MDIYELLINISHITINLYFIIFAFLHEELFLNKCKLNDNEI